MEQKVHECLKITLGLFVAIVIVWNNVGPMAVAESDFFNLYGSGDSCKCKNYEPDCSGDCTKDRDSCYYSDDGSATKTCQKKDTRFIGGYSCTNQSGCTKTISKRCSS